MMTRMTTTIQCKALPTFCRPKKNSNLGSYSRAAAHAMGPMLTPPNAVPWLSPSAVALSSLASSAAPFVLVDRHFHKNGGTTFRSLLSTNAASGACQYWGYWVGESAWGRLLEELAKPGFDGRLCVEMHFLPQNGDEEQRAEAESNASNTLSRFAALGRVKRELEERRSVLLAGEPVARAQAALVPRVIEVARLREPLAWYLSFFRHFLARPRELAQMSPAVRRLLAAQKLLLGSIPTNAASSTITPNTTFLPFVRNVPNLQTATMLWYLSAEKAARGSFEELHTVGDPEYQQARRMLISFELVGTTERFSEFAVLAAELAGLPHVFYRPEAPTASHERTEDTEICPEMGRCRELVRAIAPLDHALYAEFDERFDRRVRDRSARSDGAAFQQRVHGLQQPTDGWYGVPPQERPCKWNDQMSPPDYRDKDSECATSSSVGLVVQADLLGGETFNASKVGDGCCKRWGWTNAKATLCKMGVQC